MTEPLARTRPQPAAEFGFTDPIAQAKILAEELETLTPAAVAAKYGHTAVWVRNRVALLDLSDEEQHAISAGTMSKAKGLRLLKQRQSPASARVEDPAKMTTKALNELIASYAAAVAGDDDPLPQVKRRIRAWLTDTENLTYAELGPLYGVQPETVGQWVVAGDFPEPDVKKDQRVPLVRMWRRNRAILHGWQEGRLLPGTLEPRRRTSPGRPPKQRAT